MTSIGLREPYHFTHFDDDLGERKSALLLCDYLRSYGSAKRIDERKEPFVVPGNEIIGRPINGVFHERPGGRKASPVAPGCCLAMEADRKCGLVGTSRTRSSDDLFLNLIGMFPESGRRRLSDILEMRVAASLLSITSLSVVPFDETAQPQTATPLCLGALSMRS
jgi:hypothetical protein